MIATGLLDKLAGLSMLVKAGIAAALVVAFAGAAGTATLVSSHQPEEAQQGLETAEQAQDNAEDGADNAEEAPPESPGQEGLDTANEKAPDQVEHLIPESTPANPGEGPADPAAENAENGADNAANGDENAENGADNAANGDQAPPESPGQQGLDRANQTPAAGHAPESTPANPGQGPADPAADQAHQNASNGDSAEGSTSDNGEDDENRPEDGRAFGQSQAEAGMQHRPDDAGPPSHAGPGDAGNGQGPGF